METNDTEQFEELTQEELFEQHRAEIDEMFDEKGFFRRVSDMFQGLKQPKTSREYKLARTELQRLQAPLVAILLPLIGVIVLIVVTAVSGQVEEHVTVDIAQLQQDDAPLEDTPEPPPEEIDMTKDVDVNVDVSTDVPTPDMANPAPPSPDPGGEPDKVAATPSPVTMSAVSGTVKMRGIGDGNGGGFGTLIGGGGGQNVAGCLIGIIIDFKTDGEGKQRPGYNMLKPNWWESSGYWQDAKSLLDSNLSQEALSCFLVPPKRVALNHVYIEEQSAGNGPKAFGVDNLMKPSGFVAYYSGKIRPTEKARYRFVGFFDDLMVVRINRKVVLEDNWGNKAKGTKMAVTGWSSSSPDNGKWPGPQKHSHLTVGDWFDVVPGSEMFIELMVGERPGGRIGGLLLIQKEGETYQMDGSRPILPIFASRPLGYKEKERLKACNYRISVDSPVFNSKGVNKESAEKIKKDDVTIQVDI